MWEVSFNRVFLAIRPFTVIAHAGTCLYIPTRTTCSMWTHQFFVNIIDWGHTVSTQNLPSHLATIILLSHRKFKAAFFGFRQPKIHHKYLAVRTSTAGNPQYVYTRSIVRFSALAGRTPSILTCFFYPMSLQIPYADRVRYRRCYSTSSFGRATLIRAWIRSSTRPRVASTTGPSERFCAATGPWGDRRGQMPTIQQTINGESEAHGWLWIMRSHGKSPTCQSRQFRCLEL